ncbi:MAG: hypothetical protein QW802_03545 [Candidatus Altiarchaeota archaeon]
MLRKRRSYAVISVMLVLLILSQLVLSLDTDIYLRRIRELDIRVLCLLLWIGPGIALVLITLGGILLITSDDIYKRNHAKSMIFNAFLGLILVLAFIFFSAWIGKLDLTRCI